MKSKPRTPFLRATVTGLTPGRARPLALALSCVLLTACASVGPDYREPPPVDVGSGWSLPLASESQSADLSQWWSALDDPILDRLMATALAQNLDLRQAAARIDEARALRDRVAAGALGEDRLASRRAARCEQVGERRAAGFCATGFFAFDEETGLGPFGKFRIVRVEDHRADAHRPESDNARKQNPPECGVTIVFHRNMPGKVSVECGARSSQHPGYAQVPRPLSEMRCANGQPLAARMTPCQALSL